MQLKEAVPGYAELEEMCERAAQLVRLCQLLGLCPDDHADPGLHMPSDDEDHYIWDDE